MLHDCRLQRVELSLPLSQQMQLTLPADPQHDTPKPSLTSASGAIYVQKRTTDARSKTIAAALGMVSASIAADATGIHASSLRVLAGPSPRPGIVLCIPRQALLPPQRTAKR